MPSLINKRGRNRYVATPWYKGVRGKNKLMPDDSKKSYRRAIEWENQQIEAIKANLAATNTASLDVCKWVDDYLDYIVQHNFAPKTFQEKKAAFERLDAFDDTLATTAVAAIDRFTAASFFNQQMQTRSGNAVNKDRKNLGAAWQWGRDNYRDWPVSENPFLAVPKKPEQRTPRYVPPEADFWQVYDHVAGLAAGGEDKHIQDRVMLLAYLHLAARRSELFKAKWSDVDWANSKIRLWTRKRAGGAVEYDWLPLTRELHQQLKQWAQRRLAHSTVDKQHLFICLSTLPCCDLYYGRPFTQRRSIMLKWCERTNVKAFGWHAIRHLAASILYRLGYPQSHIQAVLRHKSANTTARYLRSLGVNEVRDTLDNGLSRGNVIPLHQRKTATGGQS